MRLTKSNGCTESAFKTVKEAVLNFYEKQLSFERETCRYTPEEDMDELSCLDGNYRGEISFQIGIDNEGIRWYGVGNYNEYIQYATYENWTPIEKIINDLENGYWNEDWTEREED